MKNSTIWGDCLEKVKENVSSQHFATWFAPIKLAGSTEGSLELEVPNRFFLEWIKDHYQPLIIEILKQITETEFKLAFKVRTTARPEQKVQAKAAKPSTEKGRTKTTLTRTKRAASLALNSKYTFEKFVVGKDNEFAHAACVAVSSNLSSKYNPLFIYGDVGLGKTHLLQAIGQRAMQLDPSIKVCYYTSEKFMNEFISFVSRQKMGDFRKKFRNVDLLLIDDIQFWAGKERTQEEFFHTFNSLYEAHKQIVVTSDKFPKDIAGIEERLRSRFEWGLVADIQPPDIETKIAILQKKALEEAIKIPLDVAELLATLSESNIRELEGYLTRVIAVSSLTGRAINLEMAKDALKNLTRDKVEKIPGPDEIIKAVAIYYNIKVSDIKSKKRTKAIALPRQVFMYIARNYAKLSFPEIGSFCDKDHSTAIHAIKKITRDLKADIDLRHAINTIKKDIGVT